MNSRLHRIPSRRGEATSGITLIEILLVIAIGAIIIAGAASGIGAINRTNLRAASTTLGAAARFSFHRAVSAGKTVRIALDFNANTISLEEAHGDITIESEEDDDDDEGDDDGARDPWVNARARLEGSIGANLGRASFSVISEQTDEDGDGRVQRTPIDRFQPRPLEGVVIHRLISPHELEPRKEGTGYIYFFPSGRAENAVVQFMNSDEIIYSVEIEALTGKPEIYNYEFGEEDLEERELRDPG
ncbi:MAG: hypothetical protein AAF411_27220 [Myxococcota bacterium]